ncbi:MAG: hypothetical protein R3249_04690 [Nitriliruptorales bacterium]|nr:hypothetical protein [Nitriliruptorales bacterium]
MSDGLAQVGEGTPMPLLTGGAASSDGRSATTLRQAILNLLRRFGLVSALWSTLVALLPPDGADRPLVLTVAMAVLWAWAIASQFVPPARVWFVVWVLVAVGLELLPAIVGIPDWSLTGGAGLLVLFAAALTGRIVLVGVVVVLMTTATLARPLIEPAWTEGAPLGSVLVFVFVGVVSVWIVRWSEETLDEQDRLRLAVASAERERAVAVGRAEAAARLHDSVLQTLTAAGQADDLETAKELARKASTELRHWVRGRIGEEMTLRGLLERRAREAADGRELSVNVTGGVEEPTDVHVLVADAMGEAVRNAATHTNGPISVYAEASNGSLAVWVADRGEGFDLDAIPDDRAGVHESILGRMARAGGTATLRRTTSGGSEWELRVS